MQKEILFASYFIYFYIKQILRRGEVSVHERAKLRSEIARLLTKHYQDHWFTNDPQKDAEYRCIKFDGKLDPIFIQACQKVNLCAEWIHWKRFDGVTIYINPYSIDVKLMPENEIYNLYNGNVLNLYKIPVKIVKAVIEFKTWRGKRSLHIKRKYNI